MRVPEHAAANSFTTQAGISPSRADLQGCDSPSVQGRSCIPDPEVRQVAARRQFSAAYKMQIVEEALRCTQLGEINALLRREGLYSSHLDKWRKKYHSGALQALRDDKRGRPLVHTKQDTEIERLRKENKRLAARLEHAEAIIEIQKKVSAMLNLPLSSIKAGEGE